MCIMLHMWSSRTIWTSMLVLIFASALGHACPHMWAGDDLTRSDQSPVEIDCQIAVKKCAWRQIYNLEAYIYHHLSAYLNAHLYLCALEQRSRTRFGANGRLNLDNVTKVFWRPCEYVSSKLINPVRKWVIEVSADTAKVCGNQFLKNVSSNRKNHGQNVCKNMSWGLN